MQNTHRIPFGYEPRDPITRTSSSVSSTQLSPSNSSQLVSQLMRPIESIDELLKQCQSYQQSSQTQKKRFYLNESVRGNNVDEHLANARHQEMLSAITKVSGRIEETNEQVRQKKASFLYLTLNHQDLGCHTKVSIETSPRNCRTEISIRRHSQRATEDEARD